MVKAALLFVVRLVFCISSLIRQYFLIFGIFLFHILEYQQPKGRWIRNPQINKELQHDAERLNLLAGKSSMPDDIKYILVARANKLAGYRPCLIGFRLHHKNRLSSRNFRL